MSTSPQVKTLKESIRKEIDSLLNGTPSSNSTLHKIVSEALVSELTWEKKQELAHELAHEDDPRFPSMGYNKSAYNRPIVNGMFFYDVPPGTESDAQNLGLRKSKGGKWYLPVTDATKNTIKSKKDLLDKRFGTGKYWEPKNK